MLFMYKKSFYANVKKMNQTVAKNLMLFQIIYKITLKIILSDVMFFTMPNNEKPVSLFCENENIN